MALIGSGAKSIPNVVSTGTWRSVDADQAFAAFAEQLGGVAWIGGVPLLYGGNIDSTNFASGMLLGGQYSVAPDSEFWMSTNLKDDISTGGPTYYCLSNGDADVREVALGGVISTGTSSLSGTLRFFIDGTQVAALPIDATQNSSATQNVSWVAPASFQLRRGNTVSFSVNDILVGASQTPYVTAATNILVRPTVSFRGATRLRSGA